MEKILKEKRNYLKIFNLVTSKGIKKDNDYEFEGINASHDFDGYTCWLKYQDLTITLLFHNKYQFDYTHSETVERFIKKVDRILLAH